ncbi:aminotransferase-like domain-containing protein [Kitasatospora mediocidica]|uniref:aminotransferase-like domain-containing protein n=1 Tax=Kitasatospora mediocidica TaxID=58352 RepID=UPI0006915462|nr:PLP-dependent aminotransferase family protein [Kitasatospora mediocidica]
MYLIGPGQLGQLLGGWQSADPAYTALAQRLRVLIREGRLIPDTRIPPERVLAEHLGLSRTTVTKAYDLLRSEGRVHSERGFGTVVSLPAAVPAGGRPPTGRPRRPVGGWAADFASAALPVPVPLLEQAVRLAATDLARSLAGGEHDPRGLPELRQAIADRYTARGLPTSPAQLLLTQGSRHSWQLLLKLRAKPSQLVLIEAPSAPLVMDAIWLHGARPCPVGLAEDGWHTDLFVTALRQVRPQIAFLTPDFQHPTGRLMSAGARQRLVRAAQQSGTLLVADESAAELRLDGPELPPSLAAHDPLDTVALLGSTRAMVGDGLRVGWIRAAPSIIHRLTLNNAAQGTETASADQVITTYLLRSADQLLAERRAVLTRQREVLVGALRRQLPGWRFRVPTGGPALWVDLGAPVSTALATAAERYRVRLLSGPRFGVGGVFDNYLRLPYTLPERALEEGVRLLARAHEETTTEPPAGD